MIKNKLNKNMKLNKYKGNGKLNLSLLSTEQRSERFIKSAWRLKIVPFFVACIENMFYAFVTYMIFSIFCFAAGYSFHIDSQFSNARNVWSLIVNPLFWLFSFIIGYFVKITTSGNLLKGFIGCFAIIKNSIFKKANKNKHNNGEINE